jgi:hypothetical protein
MRKLGLAFKRASHFFTTQDDRTGESRCLVTLEHLNRHIVAVPTGVQPNLVVRTVQFGSAQMFFQAYAVSIEDVSRSRVCSADSWKGET